MIIVAQAYSQKLFGDTVSVSSDNSSDRTSIPSDYLDRITTLLGDCYDNITTSSDHVDNTASFHHYSYHYFGSNFCDKSLVTFLQVIETISFSMFSDKRI